MLTFVQLRVRTIVSYSSKVWSEHEGSDDTGNLIVSQDMDGYSEVHEYDSSMILKERIFGRRKRDVNRR